MLTALVAAGVVATIVVAMIQPWKTGKFTFHIQAITVTNIETGQTWRADLTTRKAAPST